MIEGQIGIIRLHDFHYRHLEDRAKLGKVVQELQQGIEERENDLKLLARKHQLETKMLKSQLHQEQVKCKDLQKKLDAANIEITRLNLLELNNHGRNSHFMRYKNLRETHSAATNMSYRHGQLQVPSRSSSDSFYSKSPHCDSYRNEILYEEDGAEEEDHVVNYQQKVIEFEEQRKFHLQQIQLEAAEVKEELNDAMTAEEDNDLLAKFETLNRKDIMDKEMILDSVCNNLVQSSSFDSLASSSPKITNQGKQEQTKGNASEHNLKKTIDPKSKTKLLAALKAIDGSESFDS